MWLYIVSKYSAICLPFAHVTILLPANMNFQNLVFLYHVSEMHVVLSELLSLHNIYVCILNYICAAISISQA